MSEPSSRVPLAIATAIVVLAVVSVSAFTAIVQRVRAERRPESRVSRVSLEHASAQGRPIASEAGVFRSRLDAFAFSEADRRRPGAHPRTIQSWRMLRAFPGAPPRIPHGLTREEFLSASCNTCHERGGYSQRFGAYAPITPHPELRNCTQCHASDAAVTGIPLPAADRDPDARCRQCHAPGTGQRVEEERRASATAWPALARARPSGPPPPIPHDLDSRGNCLACHAGPGAVAEIRTDHPERASCRQCHLTIDAGDVRPVAGARLTDGAP